MHSFYLHVFNFPHPRVFSIHCGSCSGSISGRPYISRIYGKMQFSKGNFYLPCRCITANIPCAFIKVIAQEGILAAVDRIHLMTALNGIAAGIAFCEFWHQFHTHIVKIAVLEFDDSPLITNGAAPKLLVAARKLPTSKSSPRILCKCSGTSSSFWLSSRRWGCSSSRPDTPHYGCNPVSRVSDKRGRIRPELFYSYTAGSPCHAGFLNRILVYPALHPFIWWILHHSTTTKLKSVFKTLFNKHTNPKKMAPHKYI